MIADNPDTLKTILERNWEYMFMKKETFCCVYDPKTRTRNEGETKELGLAEAVSRV